MANFRVGPLIAAIVITCALSSCGGGGGGSDTPASPRLSNDSSLAGLVISSGALVPAFVSSRTDYDVTVGSSVSTFSVTPTVSHPNATISVNGTNVNSGTASPTMNLPVGDSTVAVTVTAEDKATTTTYTITVHRVSNDASLSGLILSNGVLDQVFQTTLRAYTVTVGYIQTDVQLTATTTDPNASLVIGGTTASSGGKSETITLAEGLNTVSVIVTAENGVTSETYVIEITRQSANSFAQQAYIKASNTGTDDRFGTSASLSGDTLAVGAVCEDSADTTINGNQTDDSASCAGAVYIFVRDLSGTWYQQAYVKASDANAVDLFGSAVSVSGDTLAVGAYQEDSQAYRSGAVYIFNRDTAGIWSQQTRLKSSNADGEDFFGWSLSLHDENVLAVGAPREDSGSPGIDADQADNSLNGAGAVYIFGRTSVGEWTQQAYIKASNPVGGANFGHSVSVSNNSVAVGAPYEHGASAGINGDQSDQSAFYSGAVYVITRDAGGIWSQQAYIKASNIDWSDWFGFSVSLSGDILAVGAHQEDSSAAGVNGDQADNSMADSGAAYIFVRDLSSAWSQQAYIKASNTGESDSFGYSLALSGNTLAVGALVEQSAATGVNGDQVDNSANGTGAVYTFLRNELGVWSQHAYIKAANAESDDQFGFSVTTYGDNLAVGALYEDSGALGVNGDQTDNATPNSGAVYVFK